MDERKDKLVKLVIERDISSISIMSYELGIEEEDVQNLLSQLTEEGRMSGYLTEDGKRYFRSDIKITPTKSVHIESAEKPDFLRYNTTIGKIIAMIGFIMLVLAIVMLNLVIGDLNAENFAAALILVGLIVMLSGCYWIGRLQTPK